MWAPRWHPSATSNIHLYKRGALHLYIMVVAPLHCLFLLGAISYVNCSELSLIFSEIFRHMNYRKPLPRRGRRDSSISNASSQEWNFEFNGLSTHIFSHS